MERWQKFRTFKQRGEWVELEFLAQASLRGYHVLKPWGDSLAYDVSTDQDSKTQEQEASPKNDRIFWTLPNDLTVENAAHVLPLTTSGKLELTTKDSFDPVEVPTNPVANVAL
jgi:hypothetical protein